MKKFCSICMVILAFLWICPMAVSANAPAPGPSYEFFLENVPEGTVYVDLLIYLPETDARYSPLEKGNLPEGFAEDAPIVMYCEGDFRSYTFHYRNARSEILMSKQGMVCFFANSSVMYDGDWGLADDHQQDVEKRGKIRLAMLDGEGNILQVSGALSLEPSGILSYSLNRFFYDGAKDQLKVESQSNFGLIAVFVIFGILGILASSGVEWLVARWFRQIQAHARFVFLVNVVSQFLMRLAQIFLLWFIAICSSSMEYWFVVLFLEIPVYIGEFLIYRRKMPEVSWKRCLAFTVCANTASLLLGLLML